MSAMSWAEVSAMRMRRHGLAEPSASPADAVAAMCGAHAQVISAAELSVGLRLAGRTRVDVRHALWTDRTLVKTFGPRGTVHLLPTADLPMWIGALTALPVPAARAPDGVLLNEEQTTEVVAALDEILADADDGLTVDELDEAVVAATGLWAGERIMPAFQQMWPRWRKALGLAGHRGALCFGPARGRRVTYTSPRRWLPDLAPLAGEKALPELVRRYLRAFGPATAAHFAQWVGTTRSAAKEVFASMAGELRPVRVGGAGDGVDGWLRADDTAGGATEVDRPSPGVRLLPYFDSYGVGGQPRELLFPGPAAARALAGGQAGNFPVLLVDGTVAGVWHMRRSGRRLHLTVEPLQPLPPHRLDELDEQVGRVGEILEGSPQLTIGTVTTGPHA